jgi:hypothetical protein
MITESFSNFFKKRQARRANLPKDEHGLWSMHDEHKDQLMHHLYSAHKLTHPRGDYARVSDKLGRGNMHIHHLHQAITHAIEEHSKKHPKEEE